MKDIDILLKEMEAGRMTRREFLGRAAALGITATAGATLLSQSAYASTPKRGGEVLVASEETSQTETFDPTKMGTGTDANRSHQIYNRLTNLDRDLNAVPNLAEEWESKNGATEWTFKLRKGVEFHNGKTLTAKDVIYSLGEHIKEDSTSGSKAMLTAISDMRADGDNVLKVTLSGGNADFPIQLGHDYRTSIVAEDWKDGDPVVGTGPYQLVEFEPGLTSVATRFENYWKPDSAWVNTFISQGITDATARTNGLRTGSVGICAVDARIAAMLAKDPNVNVSSTPSGAEFLWVMMCDRAPTNDLNVRLALKHCIDRQAMVDNLLQGHGTIGNDFSVNPGIDTYCREIPQHDYDPDKASFYWKKTGLSGIEIAVSNAAGDFAVDATVLLKESAKQAAGIDIEINRLPEDGYWDVAWGKVPMYASNWNSRPTADLILTLIYQSESSSNEGAWKNERFDELLIEGRKTTDAALRREIYCEAETLVHDDGGAFQPMYMNFVEGSHKRIQNYRGSAAFGLSAGLLYEEIWVDEDA